MLWSELLATEALTANISIEFVLSNVNLTLANEPRKESPSMPESDFIAITSHTDIAPPFVKDNVLELTAPSTVHPDS